MNLRDTPVGRPNPERHGTRRAFPISPFPARCPKDTSNK